MAAIDWILGGGVIIAGVVGIYYFRNQIASLFGAQFPQVPNSNVGFGNPALPSSAGSSGNCSWDTKGAYCWNSTACGGACKQCFNVGRTVGGVSGGCNQARNAFVANSAKCTSCKGKLPTTPPLIPLSVPKGGFPCTTCCTCRGGACKNVGGTATCAACCNAGARAPAKAPAKAPTAAKIAQCAGLKNSPGTYQVCLNSSFARTRAWKASIYR